jgi:HK97 family phage prohead protease
MTRRFLDLDALGAAQPPHFQAGDMALASGRMLEALPERCVRYAFSDASVGRDMHTIAPDAWDLRNFEQNPVFLWAHMDDELPVGRVEQLQAGVRLTGLVRYAEHDFAETVYQLVKGSFLNATSTGWLPLEWRAANDRKRPGGLDFTRVELLEISQVPVPALPTALVTARKAGVDTRPIVAWAERLLDQQNFAVIGKPELETLRNAAREPAGRRTPSAGGQMTQTPETAAREAAGGRASRPDLTALSRKLHTRDLFALADFCYFLAGIENIYDRVAAEAVREDDGSDFPAKLRAWIDDGDRLLLAMAGEETAEQIAGTQDEGGSPMYWSAATLETAIARVLERHGLARKGAKHSAETLRCMRAIHGHVKKAHEQLSSLLDDADDDNPEDNADDPGVDPDDEDSERRAREIRERAAKAAAIKARVGL